MRRSALRLQQQSTTRIDRKRTFPVSTELCEQAIKLLAPRLPPRGQCDIIDINPGPGVWSRALHDALQPRGHVLIEDRPQPFPEALEDLRRRAPDIFGVAKYLDHAFDPNSKLLSQSTHDANPHTDGGGSVKPNTQLLFTANLTGKNLQFLNFAGEPAKYILQLYYRSLTTGTRIADFHKLGTVKLLAWLPEELVHTVVPRCTTVRTAQSVRLECSCDITTIVSSRPYDKVALSNYRKFYDVEVYDNSLVAQRAADNSIHIPAARKQPPMEAPYFLLSHHPKNLAKLIKLEKRPILIDEAFDLYHALKREDPKWIRRYVRNYDEERRGKGANRVALLGPQKEFSKLMNRLRHSHSRIQKVRGIVNPQRELEVELMDLARHQGITSEVYKTTLANSRPKLAEYHTATDKLFKDNRSMALKVIDDYRSIHFSPPTLNWHHRNHEPLLCNPADFSPNRPLTLLEITPKPSFVQRINTVDRQICFDWLIQNIFWMGADSLATALKGLLGGQDLYDHFIKTVDGIHDPSRGGWWDLDDLRVRTLNSEMIIQLVLALERWEYRPSSDRMLDQTTAGLRSRRGFGLGRTVPGAEPDIDIGIDAETNTDTDFSDDDNPVYY